MKEEKLWIYSRLWLLGLRGSLNLLSLSPPLLGICGLSPSQQWRILLFKGCSLSRFGYLVPFVTVNLLYSLKDFPSLGFRQRQMARTEACRVVYGS